MTRMYVGVAASDLIAACPARRRAIRALGGTGAWWVPSSARFHGRTLTDARQMLGDALCCQGLTAESDTPSEADITAATNLLGLPSDEPVEVRLLDGSALAYALDDLAGRDAGRLAQLGYA